MAVSAETVQEELVYELTVLEEDLAAQQGIYDYKCTWNHSLRSNADVVEALEAIWSEIKWYNHVDETDYTDAVRTYFRVNKMLRRGKLLSACLNLAKCRYYLHLAENRLEAFKQENEL